MRWWETAKPRGARSSPTRQVTLATLAAAAVHAAPVLTALPSVRLRLFPRLSGLGAPDRVALTFDDGPDVVATPRFIETLAAHRVRATFFLLGSMLARAPSLGSDLVAAGHEVAVHGWVHRNLVLLGPSGTYRDLAKTRDLTAAVTGRAPRFFRPPYGVFTTSALLSARRLGLAPVLWSCWGRDWTREATPQTVLDTLRTGLAGGGTILLHDSDCASATGSWRASLAALPYLLDECAQRGWQVGPLGEHGSRAPAASPDRLGPAAR